MLKNAIFMLSVSILFSACAPSAMSLKPEDKKNINAITIIKVNEPPLRVMDLGSPLAAGGAIGGAVMALKSSAEELDEILQKNSFDYGDQLTNDLKEHLEGLGYKVNIINVSREDNTELMKNYNDVDAAGSDAVLDVVIQNYGYVTEHFLMSPHWRPEARVFIALADPKSNKVLYQETLMYGFHNPIMSATDLDAPKEYGFKDKEKLFGSGEDTLIAGLKDSTSSIANHIAMQLKK